MQFAAGRGDCAYLWRRGAADSLGDVRFDPHPDNLAKEKFPMLLYDDTAAEALHAATDEAGRLGATKYETAHVLLGLLRTADPVTETVTADDPRLTLDAARTALGASPRPATDVNADVAHGRRSTPEPAAYFRHAARRFTAKWR